MKSRASIYLKLAASTIKCLTFRRRFPKMSQIKYSITNKTPSKRSVCSFISLSQFSSPYPSKFSFAFISLS